MGATRCLILVGIVVCLQWQSTFGDIVVQPGYGQPNLDKTKTEVVGSPPRQAMAPAAYWPQLTYDFQQPQAFPTNYLPNQPLMIDGIPRSPINPQQPAGPQQLIFYNPGLNPQQYLTENVRTGDGWPYLVNNRKKWYSPLGQLDYLVKKYGFGKPPLVFKKGIPDPYYYTDSVLYSRSNGDGTEGNGGGSSKIHAMASKPPIANESAFRSQSRDVIDDAEVEKFIEAQRKLGQRDVFNLGKQLDKISQSLDQDPTKEKGDNDPMVSSDWRTKMVDEAKAFGKKISDAVSPIVGEAQKNFTNAMNPLRQPNSNNPRNQDNGGQSFGTQQNFGANPQVPAQNSQTSNVYRTGPHRQQGQHWNGQGNYNSGYQNGYQPSYQAGYPPGPQFGPNPGYQQPGYPYPNSYGYPPTGNNPAYQSGPTSSAFASSNPASSTASATSASGSSYRSSYKNPLASVPRYVDQFGRAVGSVFSPNFNNFVTPYLGKMFNGQPPRNY